MTDKQPNHQMLDNVTHKDLRVDMRQLPQYADSGSFANVFISEFRQLQNHYPIFFRKHPETAKFEAIAMFGFGDGENLFLGESGWDAQYIPLSIQRRPFMIGFQSRQVDGVLRQEPVVHIDMDSPRVGQEEGEAVFLAHGGQSQLLERVSSVLKAIHEGHQQTAAFIETLLEHELIEPVKINVELKDGSKHELNSLYTLHEEKLNALAADALYAMHQKGYLQHCYMLQASISSLGPLIERKNARLQAHAG